MEESRIFAGKAIHDIMRDKRDKLLLQDSVIPKGFLLAHPCSNLGC